MSLLRAAHTHSPTAYPSSPAPHYYSSTTTRPPLRVFASGTLFLTHTLFVAGYPEAGGVARAHNVRRTRGGHGANVLSVLAQFRIAHGNGHSYTNGGGGGGALASPGIVGVGARSVGDVQFCGPLAGSEEGTLVLRELEEQGVGTRFCILREGKGIPSAWVLESGDGTKTAINHNPLQDMSHEEFVSRLGPVLAPENYDLPTPPAQYSLPSSPPSSTPHHHARKRSGTGASYGPPGSPPGAHGMSTPPFDWMHFEGRASQTTLANMTGLHGLACERGWRAHCVFSLEVARGGMEALIPHADVVFFPKHYALSFPPETAASPRAFLVAMSAHAAPHALLVVDWGAQGAALLSVPTREYLQSSGWVEPAAVAAPAVRDAGVPPEGVGSVRSGSGFWASGRPQSGLTATTDSEDASGSQWTESHPADGGTAGEGRREEEVKVVDAVGAHEAFVAGMVFALSQRVLPGRLYTPGMGPADKGDGGASAGSGRWRLEECLRFATELAGKKGRRQGFSGLRREMERAGWVLE